MHVSKEEIINTVHFVSELSVIFSKIRENNGRPYFHQLAEEVAFAKIYIAETATHYACELDVAFCIRDTVKEKYIPVLTLQKLIEASIIATAGTAAAEKEKAIIRVYDDGCNLLLESNTLQQLDAGHQTGHPRGNGPGGGCYSLRHITGEWQSFVDQEGITTVYIPLSRSNYWKRDGECS